MSVQFKQRGDALQLGDTWDIATGEQHEPVTFDLSSHLVVKGVTRCGKGVCFEMKNLLGGNLLNTSVLNIDPTGQNYAVCSEAWRKAGRKTYALNPKGLHLDKYPDDMKSVGCNPIGRGLKKDDPDLFEKCIYVADAWDWSTEGQRFFDDAGRFLVAGVIGYVKLCDGDDANLATVLELLTETEKLDDKKQPTKGLRFTATGMATCGNKAIEAVGARYVKDNRTIDSVRQTAETAAQSLLSETVRADLCKDGIDWTELAREPIYVAVIMPPVDLEFHKPWIRLIVVSALNALYDKAGKFDVITIFLLSEFFSLGNNLKAVEAAMGAAAKYGCVMVPIVQNWGQLVKLYGREGAQTFIANTSALLAYAPNDNDTASFLSDYAGEHWVLSETRSENAAGEVNKSVSMVREKRWSASRLRELPKFHALVWKYHHSEPVPVYMEPYFLDPKCLALARPDPYPHPVATTNVSIGTKTRKGGAMRWLMRKVAAAVVIWLVLVVISVSWVTISNMVQSR